jgi:prevent-host-death family protein
MPRIESISQLRDHAREISEYCHKQEEPVFLTTNGKGDLVVMAVEQYERLQAEIDLLSKLGVAQAELARGEKVIGHKTMMKQLKQRIAQRGA